MEGLFENLEHWKQVKDMLRDKKYLLVSCPSFYNKSLFCDSLLAENYEIKIIQLKPHNINNQKGLQNFWNSFTEQLSLSENILTNKFDLYKNLKESISNFSKNIIIILSTDGQGKEKFMFRIVDMLHDLITENSNSEIKSKLSILIIDNYTLHFYEKKHTESSSRWYRFKRIFFEPFKKSTIEDILPKEIFNKEKCAEAIIRYTSGHCRLVIDAISGLVRKVKIINENNYDDIIKNILLESDVIDSFINVILQNPSHYLPILEYYKQARITESNKADIQHLIHIGIILQLNKTYSICPSIITSILEDFEDIQDNLPTIGYEAISPNFSSNATLNIDVRDKVKVFISHSSKDITIVEAFVENILQLALSIPSERIFCTSMEGHGVKSGEYIPDRLREEIKSASLAFLFISKNYKSSEVCLNEVGAAWVLLEKEKIIPVLLPDIECNELGFLDLGRLGIKVYEQSGLLRLIQDNKENLNPNFDLGKLHRQMEVFLRRISH